MAENALNVLGNLFVAHLAVPHAFGREVCSGRGVCDESGSESVDVARAMVLLLGVLEERLPMNESMPSLEWLAALLAAPPRAYGPVAICSRPTPRWTHVVHVTHCL